MRQPSKNGCYGYGPKLQLILGLRLGIILTVNGLSMG